MQWAFTGQVCRPQKETRNVQAASSRFHSSLEHQWNLHTYINDHKSIPIRSQKFGKSMTWYQSTSDLLSSFSLIPVFLPMLISYDPHLDRQTHCRKPTDLP